MISLIFKKTALKLLNTLGVIETKIQEPKSLLIYYGFPSLINGAKSIDEAVDTYKLYNYVILGDGLHKTTHQEHINTQTLIGHPLMQENKVFGYIDAGVSTQNLSIKDIKKAVDSWKEMGVIGIFLDDFGFDFRVSRQRQNMIIDYIHLKNLVVIVNGWNPDDIFKVSFDDRYNPNALETHLQKDDFYLMESYKVSMSQYSDAKEAQKRSAKIKKYQEKIGFKILSTTTSNEYIEYEAKMFFYAWYYALLEEHEAISWGEVNFGASSQTIPWRNRPKIEEGLYFTSKIKDTKVGVKRETNLGNIEIDILGHNITT